MNCSTCQTSIIGVDASVDAQRLSLRLAAQCGHEVTQGQGRALWAAGMRWTLPVIDGASLLAAERYRQVHQEGYTPSHDADQDANELAWAAWCLLDAAASDQPVTEAPRMWPSQWEWKPEHSDLRRLVIAGALIAAELDRRLMEGRTGG